MAAALTADLVARAVIAAANEFDHDPLAVMTATRGHFRRSLPGAAAAIAKLTEVPETVVERIVGLGQARICQSRSRYPDVYRRAYSAASRALVLAYPAAPEPAPPPAAKTVVPPDQRAVVAIRKPRVLSGGAVRREVFAALTEEPGTPPDLARRLNFTEAAVRQALDELIEGGEVTRDAMTAEGWRVQYWRVASCPASPSNSN